MNSPNKHFDYLGCCKRHPMYGGNCRKHSYLCDAQAIGVSHEPSLWARVIRLVKRAKRHVVFDGGYEHEAKQHRETRSHGF